MGVFSTPKPKPPPAPVTPPPPTPVDPAVIEARNQMQANLRRRSGRQSTILTSPQGLATGSRSLLGE